MSDPDSIPLLAARKLVKRFGDVTVLNGVDLELRAGEVHALCGENGAGKSTLIKSLSGLYPAGEYGGEILVDGKVVTFNHTRDAERAGVAVMYQELALVPELTVAENIFLGDMPRRLGGLVIDWPRMFAMAAKQLERFRLNLSPHAHVNSLGVGQQQIVEIAKALAKKSRVLILDEPTAALAEHEVQVLLRIVDDLRKSGMAMLYVSHKLDEVFAIADRITVLRDGKTISTKLTAETNRDEVIRQMVGREIVDLYPQRTNETTEPLLQVEHLTVSAASDRGPARTVLRDVSLDVRAGEVLGIGGLMGAGRSELLMHLFGAFGRRIAGKVTLLGKEISARATPTEIVRAGMVLVSEDRKRYGLVLENDIAFNLSLSNLDEYARPIAGTRMMSPINRAAERRQSMETYRGLQVKAQGLTSTVGRLSGGNQQKIVIGKALMAGPKVVLLDEPTRGIDVGAKAEIYKLINRLAGEGKAVVLVSSELPELMGMSDRIMMLSEGRVTRTFRRGEVGQRELLAAAMGEIKEKNEERGDGTS